MDSKTVCFMGAYLKHAPPCMAATFSVEVCKSCCEAIYRRPCRPQLLLFVHLSLVFAKRALLLSLQRCLSNPFHIALLQLSNHCFLRAMPHPAALASRKSNETKPKRTACPAPHSHRILNGNAADLTRFDGRRAALQTRNHKAAAMRKSCNPCRVADRVCRHVGRSITRMEWKCSMVQKGGMVTLFAIGAPVEALQTKMNVMLKRMGSGSERAERTLGVPLPPLMMN